MQDRAAAGGDAVNVTTLPPACPHGQCRALLVLNRGEMDALRDFAYVVYTCSNGHTVQVGEPPRLRDSASRPAETHPYRCRHYYRRYRHYDYDY